MAAYILRRVLLMIPTLFGILAISFLVIQFAPGGPVEQVIARITGQNSGDALSGGGGDAGATNFDAGSESSRYRGSQGLDPGIHRPAGKAVRLRQAAARALRQDAVGLCPLRFRRQLFPRYFGAGTDPGKDAGVDHNRPVDHADFLSDLDTARNPQGCKGRLAPSMSGRAAWSSLPMPSPASCSASC